MDDKHTQLHVKRLGPGDDLEMINTPSLWPWKTMLPVINNQKECPFVGGLGMPGVIFKETPTVVHVGLILLGLTGQCFSYDSVTELLAAGWRVD